MVADDYTLESVAKAVKHYDGVRRKRMVGTIAHALHIENPNVVASYGEDAAVIQNGHTALLLASDGIWSKLMDVDPYWAGYCAILVNVHDIAAMGGSPVAMVDVLSTSSNEIMMEVGRGMHDASIAFGVPVVGGHFHPETPYNVIDVSILGVAELKNIIYSSKAEPGNSIIVAIDLNGRVHPSAPMNWDSVTMKTPDTLRSQIGVMRDLGEHHYITAGKDISNPGIIGTLGMLIEASGVGAIVDLTTIPCPDLEALGITFEQWVRMYPGMGFIMTADQSQVDIICKKFHATGMTAHVIGTINSTKQFTLVKGGAKTILFDFCTEGITNI